MGLKSLQEYSADGISRRHFQMQVFFASLGLNRSDAVNNGFLNYPSLADMADNAKISDTKMP